MVCSAMVTDAATQEAVRDQVLIVEIGVNVMHAETL